MKAVSLQILFVLRVLCLATLVGGQPKAPLKCSIECRHFTSEIAAKRIRSYRLTEPRCTKRAVILITLKSVEICADPDAEWVKKIVKKLDQKKAAASPLPRNAISAAAPEDPGVFQKHVGLIVTAPAQATAPTSFSQGTGTTVLERIHAPAARTEVSSKSPPATQDTTLLPPGSSSVMWEVAARSEVIPEANGDSLKSPAPSTTFAPGVVSSQPTPPPTALVHGFDNAIGSTEEPVGHPANATADVRDMTSPGSNSDPVAITKGSDHPVLSTNEPLDPTSARANAPDTASSSFSSDLASILDSTEIATVPATPVPPATTSVSTLNSTTATDKGPSVHTKAVSSSADAFGTKPFDYSSPVGKQEPSEMLVFISQVFSGQARVQMTTERPNDLPLPSFLSRSHFVIPVSVVGGLMACSVAVVWLYLKFGVKREEMSREMVQGLLYQKEGHQNNVYPMEVI
ncbi:uncharacterized protein LOC127020915 [Gymnogyps californianus]|uniref:uncharacterized protein LOC127020915 n=1 Tax=Gymnogyps californianus TaxID=33616 RepID=UPI0021C6635E|nr:uncharacterized protein LOC127020915 [Gymnogyps californianus]